MSENKPISKQNNAPIDHLTRNKAILKLLSELEERRKSGEENGWISADEMRARFDERLNESVCV